MLNSFKTSSNFFHLLITFANNLDTDQDRQNVGPDLGPNWLTMKELFEKDNFEKMSADDNKSLKNYPACKEFRELVQVAQRTKMFQYCTCPAGRVTYNFTRPTNTCTCRLKGDAIKNIRE